MTTTATTNGEIVLVPTDRFFVLETELDAGAPAAGQVEILLEEASPFPLAQVFHGFVASTDGLRAIAFAAFRRRFTDEERAEWPRADAVVPSFLALLVRAPTEPLVVVHVHEGSVTGVGWDGRAALPVAVAARAAIGAGPAPVDEVTEELRRRLEAPAAEVRQLEGPIGVAREDDGGVVFRIGGLDTARLTAGELASADVRDKSFLDERRRLEADQRVWNRLLAAAVALVLLAAALEAGAWALGGLNARRRAEIEGRAEEVARIEAASTMAARVEDLAARQERPLEWLAQAAAVKPRSVYFLRAASRGERVLEIEAQTANAGDVGAYEAALRQLDGVSAVEVSDLRSREGRTTFVVLLRFEAAPAAAGGAS